MKTAGWCLVMWSLLSCGTAMSADMYVATNGNDAWTGKLSAPNAGKTDGPFATCARAQQEVRKLNTAGQPGKGITVFVRGGTYCQTATFRLGAEDSGTEAAPTTYQAFAKETPRLVGAREVTGFKPYREKILQCDLKALGMDKPGFRQLIFNGQRQTLARSPNFDPSDPHGGQWAFVADVEGDDNKREFFYGPKEERNWAKPQTGQVCIFPYFDWAWNIVPIASADKTQRKITMGQNVSYDLHIGDRYFVQNLMEELDSPGEWYLDRDTATLYFWPPAEITPGSVLIPAMDTVVSIEKAESVRLQGFIIEACEGDAVKVTDSRNCLVAASTVRNCGATGIVISGGENSGARGNDVYACGESGINITGGDRKTLTPGKNFADNNYVHHCALIVKTYRPGVNVNGVGNSATHNLIHDMPHAGLLLGGNDNLVEFNIVHHVNLQSGDTGGIYFCSRDWTQRGNIIRYNIFHHCGGFGKTNSWAPVRDGKVEFKYPHFTWGIYLDDPTTGTLVYGNILYNVPVCALHNHGGRDNTWENNVIVDAPALNAGMLDPNWGEWPPIYDRLKQVRTPDSPYLTKYPELAKYADTHPEEMSGVKFLHNIVYYTSDGTRRIRGEQPTMQLYGLRMRPEDFEQNEWDYNCVYAESEMKLRIDLTRVPGKTQNLTWSEWCLLGKDAHSVLADPLFVDVKNRDFHLKPDSPALKLGFKPIPVEKIGPYQHSLRATWPVKEAPGVSALGALETVRYYEPPGFQPEPARDFSARDGAGNFFGKLSAKQSVKVAYFGGGIHYADGWRAGVLKWLRESNPGLEITEIAADINDCVRGSAFSAYRFQRDVLSKKPDLVWVDFASDDSQTPQTDIQRAVEGVVRQAWKADPNLDICFVYAFRKGYETAYKDSVCPPTVTAYEKIANQYGIPSINMGYRLWQLVDKDQLVWSNDGARPLPAGNQVYTQAIATALQQLASAPKPVRHELKRPLVRDNWESAKLAPISQTMLTGDWKLLPATDPLMKSLAQNFDQLWVTSQPGAKLTFKFKGTAASIFDLMGPDTGQVRVTVDGKDAGVRSQVDPWCHYQRLAGLHIASGLKDEVHTVMVELLPEPPDRTVSIERAKKLPNFNPEAFKGIGLRFGYLRLLGDLVD